MIENYCMKVVQFLNNKEDIKKEVEAMIYDMLEERFDNKLSYSDDEISIVLKELGSPYILAMKYTNLPKKIVSEKNIYKFYYIYAIILFILGISLVFSIVFNAFSAREAFVIELFNSIGGFIVTALVAFACLSIVFMLMEHFNKEIKLNHTPSKKAAKTKKQIEQIKRKRQYSLADKILEIIFISAFLIFVAFFMDTLYIRDNGTKILIFNEAYIKSILWIINLIGGISIIGCIYQIVSPKRTIIKEFAFYGFDIVSTIIYSIILLNLDLFATQFINYLKGFEFVNNLFIKYNEIIFQVPFMVFIGIVVVFSTIELLINLHRIIVTRYDD